MHNIKVIGMDPGNYIDTKTWITKAFSRRTQVYNEDNNQHHIDIYLIQINSHFDWVHINRLRKKFVQSRFIILMDERFIRTAPIAVRLNVQALHITPIKQSILLKSISDAMDNLTDLPALRENLLRKLLYGEIKSNKELEDFQLFSKMEHIPNIICLVQGNDKAQNFIENEDGGRIVRTHLRSVIKNHLSHSVKDVHYISYSNYLAVLFHIPYVYKSIKEWEELRYYLLKMITGIEKEYGIVLHVGIGSVYNDPLKLELPFREAEKALNQALIDDKLICFYEELANDQHLQKCIEFIANHYHEELSIKKVAAQIHLSHTYFSRLFKKEIGVSFVEYVTNIRLKRAKWLLANTNDSIESIADQVGFNTPNYFSSIFKKNTGISPSDYREQHLINANV